MAASGRVGDERRGDRSTRRLKAAVAGPNRQAGCRGQRCCSAIGRSHRSLPWDEDLACIIRRCSAASSEPWPKACLRHLMTDRDSAKSRRSRQRPRPGWYLWPATRPRSTAIRMNCGRHGFWPAMRASADRRRVTEGLGLPGQGTVCKLLGRRGNQAAQGALLSGTPRRRVRARDGGSSVVSTARSRS